MLCICNMQVQYIIDISEEQLPIAEQKHDEITALHTRSTLDFEETAGRDLLQVYAIRVSVCYLISTSS